MKKLATLCAFIAILNINTSAFSDTSVAEIKEIKNSVQISRISAIKEKLENKKLIKLTEKELVQITINKASEEKVAICAGCTNGEELTLKEMFSSEKNFLADSAEEWLNEMIK